MLTRSLNGPLTVISKILGKDLKFILWQKKMFKNARVFYICVLEMVEFDLVWRMIKKFCLDLLLLGFEEVCIK